MIVLTKQNKKSIPPPTDLVNPPVTPLNLFFSVRSILFSFYSVVGFSDFHGNKATVNLNVLVLILAFLGHLGLCLDMIKYQGSAEPKPLYLFIFISPLILNSRISVY